MSLSPYPPRSRLAAGGIVVHTVGGMAALIGSYFSGPRIGRFGVNGEVNRDYRWVAMNS